MNKITYIVLVMMVLVIPVIAINDFRNDKFCYQDWLIPNVQKIWFCEESYGVMDHSFFTYEAMNNYYHPPMKEINLTGGETQTLTKKSVSRFIVTGGHTYQYVYTQGGNN